MMILYIFLIVFGSVVFLAGILIRVRQTRTMIAGAQQAIAWSQGTERRANAFVQNSVQNGFRKMSRSFGDDNMNNVSGQVMNDEAHRMQEQMLQEQMMMEEQMGFMTDPYQNPGQDIVVDKSYHGIDHGSAMDSMHDTGMDSGMDMGGGFDPF